MRKLLVVLGVPVDNLTMDEALDRCDEFVAVGRASGRTHQIATVNADFVVNSIHDPELQRILQESDMATADGMPLVWGARLLGGRLPGRVTGADMVPALAQRAAQKGYSIFFLGAREGVAAKAAAILQERNPGMIIAGVLSPPPRSLFDMDRSVLDAVKAAKPDILLVAFGNPKQEKWIRMHAHELHVPICIGVGGTFDMIVGVTKRAPSWVQKIGLEWAYRLSQEPRRLAKRYLHDFGYFGYFFARQWWGMRRGTAVSMTPTTAPEPAQAPPITLAPTPEVALAPTPAPPIAPIAPTALVDRPEDAEPLAVEGQAEPHVSDTQQTLNSTPVLYLRGRLDINNHEEFTTQAHIMLDESPYLIINMSDATFLDSSALGTLVALANRARTDGGALWLVEMPPQIKSLLSLVRLESFFEVYPDAEAAEFKRRQAPQPVAPRAADNGWSVVHMPRIFDGNNIGLIVERCLAGIETNPHLVMDFSETSFMSSAGMAALLKLDKAARAKNGALRIASCSHDLIRTLKLIKLDNILTVMQDVATATRDPIATAPDLSGLRIMPAGQQ
ncbi:WecB/TagA/CpsF family glycosyltransferase [Oscillochloris sp. ZM17-4]|uniref:WecB/TagA/CpsF family glycosyltransferase n=1 Tax=Oscillochloris sp. ZM17-4 TaxID=2866714 RepID=UPI001C72D4A3|nr:WecB/TagA/CpsF family glycosyltransferase [Oscillochloris sp. ZM17-4]MBX0328800.1 WecB/TagA/CpsF family glycosyltransferase [Oscillochloris sp. ZM17-4]